MAIRRKRTREPEEKPERTFVEPTLPGRIEVAVDQASQAQALAFALEDEEARGLLVALGVTEDHFAIKEYSDLWTLVVEPAFEKGIAIDRTTVAAYADDSRLVALSEDLRKHKPPRGNLLDVVDRLRWGSAVISAAEAVPEFAELLRKRSRPEDVVTAARAITEALEDGRPIRSRHAKDQRIVDDHIEKVKLRKVQGRFPFGIPGFDIDESIEDETNLKRYRTQIGTAPGKITVVTALSGNGKSTFVANLLIAQALVFEKKILFGAWEDKPGEVLELAAAIYERINLTALHMGLLSEDEERRLSETMRRLAERIEFVDNPLARARKKRDPNDSVLADIHTRILESGAKVAFFDLWAKAFAFANESEEREALDRQQTIAQETDCHCVLVQQQNLKKVEVREDKRPTREGIFGASQWVGVSDTLIGIYRPDLYKDVPATTIELPIMKQRIGKWPIGIEGDFDPEYGRIYGCRTVSYDAPGTKVEASKNELERAIAGKRGGKKGK